MILCRLGQELPSRFLRPYCIRIMGASGVKIISNELLLLAAPKMMCIREDRLLFLDLRDIGRLCTS